MIRPAERDTSLEKGLSVQNLARDRSPRRSPYDLDGARLDDQIARYYRKGRVAIITDNISTRTGEAAAEWLRRHPRIRLVFTPKHGSWRNQVWVWFGILTRSAFRHRSFVSVAALTQAIYRFGKYRNDVTRRPFEWTYTCRVLYA